MTNWVETLGHAKGYLQFRWQRVSRELTEADGPTVGAGRLRQGAPRALPYYESEQDLRAKTGGRELPSARNRSATGRWDSG